MRSPDKQTPVYHRSLLRRYSNPVLSVLLSCVLMSAFILVVYTLNIPNPNMILITGLVFLSALFGYPGGITAGVFMFGYTLFFFSTDNDFVTFTPQNMQKVFVSLFGIVADLLFVCHLKRAEQRAYRSLEDANAMLQEDNQLLEQVSMEDALTGLGNRMALRKDFPLFQNHTVFTLFIDVDNFKAINDTYGHDVGDACLQKAGRILLDTFGGGQIYRYGGDEFLVICTDLDREDFLARVSSLAERKAALSLDEDRLVSFSFSGGYVYGDCRHNEDLRGMFRQADDQLYQAKGAGKNRIVGQEYHN